jgi:glycosyltransferase involved in cell wall biosynthesis
VIIHSPRAQRPIVVVTPSYQNAAWLERNLSSILSQDYDNYRVIYTDDGSPDGTADRVGAYLRGHANGGRVTLRRNARRQGALRNIYEMVHLCRGDEIVVNVDGDDWLAHPGVLRSINEVYGDEDVWMTWGQYRSYPANTVGCSAPIPSDVVARNGFRDHPWSSSHLRTYRAWLFQQIRAEDLMMDGAFAPMAGDVPMMFAMLEMSGGHGRFVDEVLYVYNEDNPLNDHKVDRPRQLRTEAHFRGRRRYDPLAARR